MASKGKVTLTFAGDSDQLDKAFKKVGDSADQMAKDVSKSSDRMSRDATSGFDRVGDAAGDTDTRMMGFRDGITGVEDSMAGFKQLSDGDMAGGLFTMAMGFGDLASSVENLIAPMASRVAAWVSGNATMAASSVTSAAAQVGAWISTAAAAMVSAAQIALAWLISIGPILIVIALVVLVAFVIWKNFDKIKVWVKAAWEFVKEKTMVVWGAIKTALFAAIDGIVWYVTTYIGIVKAVVSTAWNWIKSVSSKVWNGIKTVISGAIKGAVGYVKFQIGIVKGIFRTLRSAIGAIMGGVSKMITAPFRKGFGAIKGIWNRAIGGKGFTVPDWVPGVGGRGFKIPKLAKGGLVKHTPGGTIANIGEGGKDEAVVPLDRLERMMGVGQGGGTPVVVNVAGSVVSENDLIAIVRDAMRRGALRSV